MPELGVPLLLSGTVCVLWVLSPQSGHRSLLSSGRLWTISPLVCPRFRRIVLVLLLLFPHQSPWQVSYPHPFGAHSAISMRTENISPFECLYSDWPFVVCCTSCTYCRSTNFMNTCRRGTSIWIRVTVASATCSCSCIRSSISYTDIRGLCGSNVHTRVFCHSSKALHSCPLPSVSHKHTVNISLHYFTTYFHRNSLTRSTVQTQPSLSNSRPSGWKRSASTNYTNAWSEQCQLITN